MINIRSQFESVKQNVMVFFVVKTSQANFYDKSQVNNFDNVH